MQDYERDDIDSRRARRDRIRAEKKRKRRRQVMIYRCLLGVFVIVVFVLIVSGIAKLFKPKSDDKAANMEIQQEEPAAMTEPEAADNSYAEEPALLEESEGSDEAVSPLDGAASSEEIPQPIIKSPSEYAFNRTDATKYMGSDEMTSSYGILVNADDHTIIAEKNSGDTISPASMTKILTLLVACENIKSLDEEVEITIEATDYSFSNDCSAVGFAVGERVTVRDLLYGTILPSGGDAAYALACHVAGSHDAFVGMMNDKLSQLGLSGTAHFTNCVGIYSGEHYCRPIDMAVILGAAMENPLAREVLSAHRYTTSQTAEHPDGIEISNLFLRRIEDKDTGGDVIGAKTGFVVQSRNCAASYYTCNDGKNYICVTVDAHSSWRAIYDHVAVYNIYAAGNTGYHKA